MSKPIETLSFSQRMQKCLTQHAPQPVRTIRQLVNCPEATLTAIPNSGQTVVEEIREKLAQHGFRLKGEAFRPAANRALSRDPTGHERRLALVRKCSSKVNRACF